eukprot:TRINITY_DN2769_c0_g1_i4.p1 TRINITY_DN2769_c0_g1~~TRINITY_DN2769_c0_g1_i4.p1  ORF type:complete len:226 (+),score=19.37 TRINITY_DN2769_c0_g1_i4:113-790(+)
MIGRAIASQVQATFFAISSSTLTSKWHGEGEKMYRTLFSVALAMQPAVIFIDEIDSLLSARTDNEFEGSRRLKTEFLTSFDGLGSSDQERILVIGATNRPQDLDQAVLRRLVKRLYIPLPDAKARRSIILNLLSKNEFHLSDDDLNGLVHRTDGYSGSDLRALCGEASMGPIRGCRNIAQLRTQDMRPINLDDFNSAIHQIRPSVSPKDLHAYEEWDRSYGSFSH